MWHLFQRWRGRIQPPSDHQWQDAQSQTPFAVTLALADQNRLRQLVGDFLRTKEFEATDGTKITDAMRLRIALDACLPILNLGLSYYDGWSSIIIYPGDFRVHDRYQDETGIVHEETRDLCGESLSGGPMVLSWQALRDEASLGPGHKLVIHECAHKLDILNGPANGFPPLHADMDATAWSDDFRAAYDDLCRRFDTGATLALDPYATTDPAEFFSVSCELFFSDPAALRGHYPAVYRHLSRFFRQDPLRHVQEAIT